MGSKVRDLTGLTFNRITVIERALPPEQAKDAFKRRAWWRCTCALGCGKEAVYMGSEISSGRTKGTHHPPPPRSTVVFDADMDAVITGMIAEGAASWEDMALRIGVSRDTCIRRAKELGITKPKGPYGPRKYRVKTKNPAT